MISVRGAWRQVRSLRFGSTFFVLQSQTAVAFPGAFLCFGGDYENALHLIGCSKYQHAVDLIWVHRILAKPSETWAPESNFKCPVSRLIVHLIASQLLDNAPLGSWTGAFKLPVNGFAGN
jgi:hypothetical protein